MTNTSAAGRQGDVGRFVDQCRQMLGADAAVVGDEAARFAIDDQRPGAVCFPKDIDALSRCVAAAAATDLAIVPVGNGTQLGMGRVPRRYDVAVSTRRMCRIVAHEAADMTVTVEAGATLAELDAAMEQAAQFLPLDAPRPNDVTVGALIATDASGPLRMSCGRVRDLLIGVRAVLADGTIVKGGGRVVKNVAGYDVMKLLTGSHGSLAIIAEATFKIRPRPAVERCFVIDVDRIDAAVALGLQSMAAEMQPAFVEGVNAAAGREIGLANAALIVGLHGSQAEIDAQRLVLETIAGKDRVEEVGAEHAPELVRRLRDLPAAERTYGCRIATLPSRLAATLAHIEREAQKRSIDAALLAHVGSGAAVLRCDADRLSTGALADFAAWIQAQVSAAEGGVVVFDKLPKRLKEDIDPWGTDRTLSATQLSLMRNLKAALDPQGLLSPGRFVGGL